MSETTIDRDQEVASGPTTDQEVASALASGPTTDQEVATASGTASAVGPGLLPPQTGGAAAFTNPAGMTYDATNNIYVTCPLMNSIYKNNALFSVASWSLKGPTGICFLNGSFYIADTGNSRIFLTNLDKSTTSTISTSSAPYGICATSTTIYISAGNTILFLNPSNVVNTLYTATAGTNYMFMCTDGTNLYVCDYTTSSIYKIPIASPTPVLVPLVNTTQVPTSVAYDSVNSILFSTDIVNNVVYYSSPTRGSGIIAGNGSAGYAGDGAQGINAQLNTPINIIYNTTDGRLYIADYNNNNVRYVDFQAVYVPFSTTTQLSRNLVNSTATLPTQATPPPGVTTSTSTIPTTLSCSNQPLCFIKSPPQLTATSAVASSACYYSGTLYYANGSTLMPGSTSITSNANPLITCMYMDSTIALFVDNANHLIYKSATPTPPTTTFIGRARPTSGTLVLPDPMLVDGNFPLETDLYKPVAICRDPPGTYYFIENWPSTSITPPSTPASTIGILRKIDFTGRILTILGNGSMLPLAITLGSTKPTYSSNLKLGQLGGLVADKYSNVYVSDVTNNVIVRITAEGVIQPIAGLFRPTSTLTIASIRDQNIYGAYNVNLQWPSSLALDSTSTILYCTSLNGSKVFQITNLEAAEPSLQIIAGVLSVGAQSTASGIDATNASLVLPTCITCASNNIYFIDGGNGRICTITPQQTQSIVSSAQGASTLLKYGPLSYVVNNRAPYSNSAGGMGTARKSLMGNCVVDRDGYLYYIDSLSASICRLSMGTTSTFTTLYSVPLGGLTGYIAYYNGILYYTEQTSSVTYVVNKYTSNLEGGVPTPISLSPMATQANIEITANGYLIYLSNASIIFYNIDKGTYANIQLPVASGATPTIPVQDICLDENNNIYILDRVGSVYMYSITNTTGTLEIQLTGGKAIPIVGETPLHIRINPLDPTYLYYINGSSQVKKVAIVTTQGGGGDYDNDDDHADDDAFEEEKVGCGSCGGATSVARPPQVGGGDGQCSFGDGGCDTSHGTWRTMTDCSKYYNLLVNYVYIPDGSMALINGYQYVFCSMGGSHFWPRISELQYTPAYGPGLYIIRCAGNNATPGPGVRSYIESAQEYRLYTDNAGNYVVVGPRQNYPAYRSDWSGLNVWYECQQADCTGRIPAPVYYSPSATTILAGYTLYIAYNTYAPYYMWNVGNIILYSGNMYIFPSGQISYQASPTPPSAFKLITLIGSCTLAQLQQITGNAYMVTDYCNQILIWAGDRWVIAAWSGSNVFWSGYTTPVPPTYSGPPATGVSVGGIASSNPSAFTATCANNNIGITYAAVGGAEEVASLEGDGDDTFEEEKVGCGSCGGGATSIAIPSQVGGATLPACPAPPANNITFAAATATAPTPPNANPIVAGGNGSGNFTSGAYPISTALSNPTRLAFDYQGNMYIVDKYQANNFSSIIKLDSYIQMQTNYIYNVAGTGTTGYAGDGQDAAYSKLNAPQGVCYDSYGNMYIADTGNNAVRQISVNTGIIKTLFTQSSPKDIKFDKAGVMFIASATQIMRSVYNQSTQTFSTPVAYAGTGATGTFTGPSQPATSPIPAPSQLFIDARNTIYFLSGINIYRVDAIGNITIVYTSRVAGTNISSFAIDASNNIYTTEGSTMYKYLGSSTTLRSSSYTLGPLAINASNQIFYYENGNLNVLTGGTAVTIAGKSGTTEFTRPDVATSGLNGDGAPATSALLGQVNSIAIGPGNNVLFSQANGRVRVIPYSSTPATAPAQGLSDVKSITIAPVTAGGIMNISQVVAIDAITFQNRALYCSNHVTTDGFYGTRQGGNIYVSSTAFTINLVAAYPIAVVICYCDTNTAPFSVSLKGVSDSTLAMKSMNTGTRTALYEFFDFRSSQSTLRLSDMMSVYGNQTPEVFYVAAAGVNAATAITGAVAQGAPLATITNLEEWGKRLPSTATGSSVVGFIKGGATYSIINSVPTRLYDTASSLMTVGGWERRYISPNQLIFYNNSYSDSPLYGVSSELPAPPAAVGHYIYTSDYSLVGRITSYRFGTSDYGSKYQAVHIIFDRDVSSDPGAHVTFYYSSVPTASIRVATGYYCYGINPSPATAPRKNVYGRYITLWSLQTANLSQICVISKVTGENLMLNTGTIISIVNTTTSSSTTLAQYTSLKSGVYYAGTSAAAVFQAGSVIEIDLAAEYFLDSIIFYTTATPTQCSIQIDIYNETRFKQFTATPVITGSVYAQPINLMTGPYSVARYVVFTGASAYTSALAVIDENGINVAGGKTATAVGTGAGTIGNITNLNYAQAATANSYQGSFTIDLGNQYKIKSVVHYNATTSMANTAGATIQLQDVNKTNVGTAKTFVGGLSREVFDFRPSTAEYGGICMNPSTLLKSVSSVTYNPGTTNNIRQILVYDSTGNNVAGSSNPAPPSPVVDGVTALNALDSSLYTGAGAITLTFPGTFWITGISIITSPNQVPSLTGGTITIGGTTPQTLTLKGGQVREDFLLCYTNHVVARYIRIENPLPNNFAATDYDSGYTGLMYISSVEAYDINGRNIMHGMPFTLSSTSDYGAVSTPSPINPIITNASYVEYDLGKECVIFGFKFSTDPSQTTNTSTQNYAYRFMKGAPVVFYDELRGNLKKYFLTTPYVPVTLGSAAPGLIPTLTATASTNFALSRVGPAARIDLSLAATRNAQTLTFQTTSVGGTLNINLQGMNMSGGGSIVVTPQGGNQQTIYTSGADMADGGKSAAPTYTLANNTQYTITFTMNTPYNTTQQTTEATYQTALDDYNNASWYADLCATWQYNVHWDNGTSRFIWDWNGNVSGSVQCYPGHTGNIATLDNSNDNIWRNWVILQGDWTPRHVYFFAKYWLRIPSRPKAFYNDNNHQWIETAGGEYGPTSNRTYIKDYYAGVRDQKYNARQFAYNIVPSGAYVSISPPPPGAATTIALSSATHSVLFQQKICTAFPDKGTNKKSGTPANYVWIVGNFNIKQVVVINDKGQNISAGKPAYVNGTASTNGVDSVYTTSRTITNQLIIDLGINNVDASMHLVSTISLYGLSSTSNIDVYLYNHGWGFMNSDISSPNMNISGTGQIGASKNTSNKSVTLNSTSGAEVALYSLFLTSNSHTSCQPQGDTIGWKTRYINTPTNGYPTTYTIVDTAGRVVYNATNSTLIDLGKEMNIASIVVSNGGNFLKYIDATAYMNITLTDTYSVKTSTLNVIASAATVKTIPFNDAGKPTANASTIVAYFIYSYM